MVPTSEMTDVTQRLVIRGRVQGVGFRHWTAREAEKRDLSGWVRNLPDGTVEALVSGSAAAVRDMVAACERGPRLANVVSVEASSAELPAAMGFQQIR